MTTLIASTRTLLKSILTAIVIAVLVLVFFILPAEYNIDPTGLGSKLGLSALSAEMIEASPLTDTKQSSNHERKVIEVIVPAKRGVEYKFQMFQHEKMAYEWITNGAPLYFDLHGEPQGDTTGYFESYAIATLNEMKGSFTTPFVGSHGWYWRNDTDQAIVIQLTVEGQFEIIGLKQ